MLVVRYNGETETFYGSSDPSLLEKDALYIVDRIQVHAFHTQYFLSGFPYSYNSCWFEPVGTLAGTAPTKIEKKYVVLSLR